MTEEINKELDEYFQSKVEDASKQQGATTTINDWLLNHVDGEKDIYNKACDLTLQRRQELLTIFNKGTTTQAKIDAYKELEEPKKPRKRNNSPNVITLSNSNEPNFKRTFRREEVKEEPAHIKRKRKDALEWTNQVSEEIKTEGDPVKRMKKWQPWSGIR